MIYRMSVNIQHLYYMPTTPTFFLNGMDLSEMENAINADL